MKVSQHKPILAVAAVIAFTVAGCKQNTQSGDTAQKDDQSTMQRAANDVKKNADIAEASLGDSAITAKVKAAIVAESDLKSLDIKVDTLDGVVTLTGMIDAPQKMERATQLAQNIDGVKTVNNQLSVKAAG